MTKYTVEWLRGTNEGLPRVDKYIAEADGVLDAFDKAVDKYKHSAYPQIFISWDGWNKCFDNPHYDPKAVTGKTKPSHSVKHSRTGGTLQSSGWAKLYRFYGVLNFLFGLITTIVVARKYEYEGFLWGGCIPSFLL